jgi:hypothetical protein
MEDDGQPKKVRIIALWLLAVKVNVECVIQSNILIPADEILSRYIVAKTHTRWKAHYTQAHSASLTLLLLLTI